MSDKSSRILFSVREDRTITREKWEQFQARAKRDGFTPIAMLVRLIDRYLETRPSDDPTPTKTGQ